MVTLVWIVIVGNKEGQMDGDVLKYILDSLIDPIVFVDVNHIIRYMNSAACMQLQKYGGGELVGKSLFDCHNQGSCRTIREVWARMHDGLEEACISTTEGKRTFMRAVRDEGGGLVGYYERYEKNGEGIFY
jgi:nitrogen-specific signal transduction histidine kinase